MRRLTTLLGTQRNSTKSNRMKFDEYIVRRKQRVNKNCESELSRTTARKGQPSGISTSSLPP